ncbi:MAG: propionyl-CoA synthetase [Pseudomonadota bacterium]
MPAWPCKTWAGSDLADYISEYTRSIAEPEAFWAEAARGIDWISDWETVLDRSSIPLPRWFTGASLNTCYNALDRHIENGSGSVRALIYDSPVTGVKKTYTYEQLRDQVALVAGALQNLGLTKGDRVVIYMPMVPETVMAMLACARIGAVHSVVFGGFAANELAARIDDAKPKLIIAASCGIEPGRIVEYKPLLDRAIDLAENPPDRCIVFQRKQSPASMTVRDIDWAEAISVATPAPCVPVAATDPLYILYTSGTTGKPKGVVRDNGGHAVALYWSMKNIYGVDRGDVFWAASDVGWVVGHSYIVYGPLLKGCTSILYEGKPVGTPDPGSFWRVVDEHKVKVLFTAPTAIRAIKKEDPAAEHLQQYDMPNLKALFLAGERCDPDTLQWSAEKLSVPVIDHWWQTETGWPIAANSLGLGAFPIKPGSPTKAVPGYEIHVLNEEGKDVAANGMGSIAIKLPLPPGTFQTLWQNDEGLKTAYLERFPGYYLTGDAGYIDEDGYIFIMGRTDDVINVAGHRLSTGGLEEVLASHQDVAECAVIGVADALKGQIPVGLAVLKSGVDRPTIEITAELINLIRSEVGPVASFKHAIIVPRLPKTRSGKILRGVMRDIADGHDYKIPATIEDEGALEDIKTHLTALQPETD